MPINSLPPDENADPWYEQREEFDILLRDTSNAQEDAVITALYSQQNHYALAGSHDVPVVSTIHNQYWNEPTIAGSEGWFREKRVGSAQPAPGTWPSATGALDIDGSVYFSFPGISAGEASGTAPAELVTTPFKPGGDSVFAREMMTVDFITESPTIDFRMYYAAANAEFGFILVNGQAIDDRSYVTTSAGGSGENVRLAFDGPARRRITVYGMTDAGQFGGVAVEDTYTIEKAPEALRIFVGLGDSYINGAGTAGNAVLPTETFMPELALRLGADTYVGLGIGGTGFIETIGSDADSNFAGRVALALSLNPVAVLIAGGRNDTATGLAAAVTELVQDFDAIPEVYVVPTASESTQGAVRAALADGAIASGRRYLPVNIDAIPKIVGDGVHPTFAGHRELAQILFEQIAPWGFGQLPGGGEVGDVVQRTTGGGAEWHKLVEVIEGDVAVPEYAYPHIVIRIPEA